MIGWTEADGTVDVRMLDGMPEVTLASADDTAEGSVTLGAEELLAEAETGATNEELAPKPLL